MTSIESSLHPLVFPVANLADSWRPSGCSREFPLAFRTCARALAGMQKEAVVSPAVGPAWRMVCDEGPYLLGTDLAPFPLAFFCVGMLSGYATELLALAKGHSLPADWELVQDNRYTMEGSATAGTMRGAALPVELELLADSEENHGALQALLVDAVAASPAGALLRATHNGRFALQHNGQPLQPARVLTTTPSAVCPVDFDLLQPAPAHAFPGDIISKLQSAPLREGVSGGVGSSLTNDQKRTLHMQGRCRQRDDGLLEITVELFSPLGSRFRFLVEPGEECSAPRAPSPRTTGITRRSSSSSPGGAAPGRVLSPPTSTQSKIENSDTNISPATDYRRELDLATAITRITYRLGEITYTREMFVSAADEVIVVRLTADQPGALNFDVALDRPERFTTASEGPDQLLMTGQLIDGKDSADGTHTGVRYAARLRALLPSGELSATATTLQIRDATQVVLLLTAITDIRSFANRRDDAPATAANDDLTRAAGKNFTALRAAHLADYQRYFDRVSLRLGSTDATTAALATPARLAALQAGSADPGLAALFFDFGRYLLISSSRPGGFPANLQGLWAEEIQAPWNADWHLNVNLQMNYWPAEVCALSDLAQPLFAFIESLQKPGAVTAQKYYGARGWVAHVLANPWGFTAPGESASWGSAHSGSAWLCQHLWDHWLFTGDKKFLARIYPILKGSAQFYSDLLIAEPNNQWLVTAPSHSPENAFLLPDGQRANVCLGPTIDQQLLRYLFHATIESAKILGLTSEEAFTTELAAQRARLAPTRIGTDGRIMEWLEAYPEAEPTHRHISHLWGLYPGHEISVRHSPELAAAPGCGSRFATGQHSLLVGPWLPPPPSREPRRSGTVVSIVPPTVFGVAPPSARLPST